MSKPTNKQKLAKLIADWKKLDKQCEQLAHDEEALSKAMDKNGEKIGKIEQQIILLQDRLLVKGEIKQSDFFIE